MLYLKSISTVIENEKKKKNLLQNQEITSLTQPNVCVTQNNINVLLSRVTCLDVFVCIAKQSLLHFLFFLSPLFLSHYPAMAANDMLHCLG